jgi:outer membrane protein
MKSLFVLILGWLLGSAAPAADLLAVYRRALHNDPQLKEAEATRLAALESKPQAIAALLPQLSGSGTISREKDKGYSNQTEEAQADDQTIIESFPFNGRVSTTTHKYGLDLSQNLFRWQNWVALKHADAQVAQAEADYQAAQQDLIARVAQRYFDVLAAQDDLDAQRANLESVSRQLEQAEKRYQVGLIAVTDVEERAPRTIVGPPPSSPPRGSSPRRRSCCAKSQAMPSITWHVPSSRSISRRPIRAARSVG